MDFSQIALLLVVAGIFGIVAQYLKQPLLIGYLFAGIFLASLGLVHGGENLEGLSQIGVTLLLFLLGLEMNISDIPSVGKSSSITGIVQILTVTSVGFLVTKMFGLGNLESLYIAVALSFSSTVIGVKLLSEKKDMGSLYGKLTVGVLLIQDLVAIAVLMLMVSGSKNGATAVDLVFVIIKGISLFIAVSVLSKKVIPYIFEKIASNSHELIFIVSIAWALGFATFVKHSLGFTLEIGGFLAGLSLSNIHEHVQIATRTRNLRDFFLTLFFTLLGTQIIFEGSLVKLLPMALVLSAVVLVIKPIVIMTLLELMGYKRRTAFMSGVTLAQISEFSLILISVGYNSGYIGNDTVGSVTLVGVVTMIVSTYLISHEDRLYHYLKSYLGPFERKSSYEIISQVDYVMDDHIVLVGCDRTGKQLISYFRKKEFDFVVVDFNPKIYNNLVDEKVPIIFGDIGDHEIMELAGIDKARMVISTIPSLSDNLALLEYIRSMSKRPNIIMISQRRSEALELYKKGATYVIVPEVVAGEHIRHLLRVYGTQGNRLEKAGRSHFNRVIFS